MKHRKSIEKHTGKKEGKLAKILETARSAPSAGNLQAYDIMLIKDNKTKTALVEASFGQKFIAEAPVVLAIFANKKHADYYKERGHNLYCVNDASIAAAYIQLAATALGLATVWVGKFDDDKVSMILNAPDYTKPIAIIPVGYPNEAPRKTKRRNMDDLVHQEKF